MKFVIATLAGILFLMASGASAGITLTPSPANGAISGAPGQTIGWGFTLTNTTSNFLVVTGLDFAMPTFNGTLDGLFGIIPDPAFGTLTDFIGPAFILLGPAPESSTATQPFNASTQTGLASFTINASAVPGVTLPANHALSPSQAPGIATGALRMSYDLYSRSPNDPNFDPVTDTVSVGNAALSNASITITPEPATTGVLLLTALAAGCSRRNRPQSW